MWLGWTAVIAAEATFFSVIVNYWAQDRVNESVWRKLPHVRLALDYLVADLSLLVTIFLLCMVIIFSLPSKVFAWFEYITSILKVVALLLFMVAGLALILGAGPEGRVHHGETWEDGLAFRNGFKGYSNSVLLAILAIGGTFLQGVL